MRGPGDCQRSGYFLIVSPSELGNYKIADTCALIYLKDGLGGLS
jgi:hypothetical protein